MIEGTAVERALLSAASDIARAGKQFALVGGLAVSVRAEVRFTRDVDLAVDVANDDEAEVLVYALRNRNYVPVATVEQKARGRLSTIRLLSPHGIKIDLLFASSGIEHETVERATVVVLPSIGEIPVARAEELVAMKVLSMTDKRLQDRIDAQHLLEFNPNLDMPAVRENLRLIHLRGFDRGEDLEAKFAALLGA